MLIPHGRYVAILAALFGVWWVVLAIHPKDRTDWLMENALGVAAVVLLAIFYRRLVLSRLSYTLIFIFLCLHEVGAHYTYAEVPYDAWFRSLFGHTFNSLVGWQRNNFDRVVHFLYGFLLAYPIREVFLRVANVRGFWGYFLPLDLTMSTSMLYELNEWGAALVVGGDLGQAKLGTHGDEWDAHKDMALASIGALISIGITAPINLDLNRFIAHEWIEDMQFRVRDPLGEVAIKQMLDQRG